MKLEEWILESRRGEEEDRMYMDTAFESCYKMKHRNGSIG